MVEILRHCQPKGAEMDMLSLNYYASSLLYPFPFPAVRLTQSLSIASLLTQLEL